MSSAAPASDPPTTAGTTAAAEPSVTPTESPSPSAEPSVTPSNEPTPSPPPQSSAQSTTQPSASPPPQSSAPPESSAQPPSSSAQPTNEPPSSSAQPTPSPSAAPSSAAPSSDVESSAVQTTPPTSASATTSAPAQQSASASETIATSAIDLTTTDSQGRVLTTRPPVVTQTSVSTDGAGRVYTVTQVVHNPTGSLNDSGSSKGGTNGFFDNTGAVAGVFVVVGLAVTAGVLAFIFFMLRRRRRQRLDRDVAAAAAAAAAGASHHHRSAFDDDEDEKNNPATSYGGGYYAATDIHAQPQPSMGQYSDYEDPAGGYDHYAANLPPAGDRSSTATAAGMAGFGASSAQANYAHSYPPQPHDGYEEMQDRSHVQQDYNAMSTEQHHGVQAAGGYYFDPKDATQYNYTDDDAAYDYNDMPTQVATRHARSGSDGSLAQNGQDAERGLKVTNV